MNNKYKIIPEFLTINNGDLTTIEGLILHQRYRLGELLFKGKNSYVFKCSDTN